MKKDKSMPEDFEEALKKIVEYKYTRKKRKKDEKRT